MAVRGSGQLSFAEALLTAKGVGGPLDRLQGLVKWYRFEKLIGHLRDERGPGRPGYPVLVLFKALLLQSLYGLSDRELEAALTTGCRFAASPGWGWTRGFPTTRC